MNSSEAKGHEVYPNSIVPAGNALFHAVAEIILFAAYISGIFLLLKKADVPDTGIPGRLID